MTVFTTSMSDEVDHLELGARAASELNPLLEGIPANSFRYSDPINRMLMQLADATAAGR